MIEGGSRGGTHARALCSGQLPRCGARAETGWGCTACCCAGISDGWGIQPSDGVGRVVGATAAAAVCPGAAEAPLVCVIGLLPSTLEGWARAGRGAGRERCDSNARSSGHAA
eukprot:3707948-Pleurochrysis_carterae.AAC.1